MTAPDDSAQRAFAATETDGDLSPVPPWRLLAPARQTAPVVFASPHSGRDYPPEFIAASRKLRDQGLSPGEAWQHLARFLRTFRLVLPSPGVLDRARVLHVEQQWSFWDAMIVAACLDADVTRLYSEDLPGRAAPNELDIVNPFA